MGKASAVLEGLLLTDEERVREGLGRDDGSSGGAATEGDPCNGSRLGLLDSIAIAVATLVGVALGEDDTPKVLLIVMELVADGKTGITIGDRVVEGDLEAEGKKEELGVLDGAGELDTSAKGKTVATGEHIPSTSNLTPTSPKSAGPAIPTLKVAVPSVVRADGWPNKV